MLRNVSRHCQRFVIEYCDKVVNTAKLLGRIVKAVLHQSGPVAPVAIMIYSEQGQLLLEPAELEAR